MTKRALFKIEAEGDDITALIADRFLGLTVSDSDGKNSDTMTLTLDNRDDKLKFPSTGAKLGVWIGSKGALVNKGIFSIDEITEGIEDGVVEVSGKAADMTGSIKSQKTRTWEGPLTLGKLAEIIAAEHGYSHKVHTGCVNIELGHLNQRSESDMNLLTRLCETHGSLMKIGNNCLLIVPREAGENADGEPLPIVDIDDPSESSGRVTIQERGKYAAVQTCFFDEALQQLVNVVVNGEGMEGPTLELKGRCKNSDEANSKAKAKLEELARGRATMTLKRPLTPEIVSPGKVRVSRHRQSANGIWFVKGAEHYVGPDEVSGTTLRLSTHEHEASKGK
ncbi:MAG: phage late control D family protein [Aeromonadaceae bacterium]